jgi:hypothetical protein
VSEPRRRFTTAVLATAVLAKEWSKRAAVLVETSGEHDKTPGVYGYDRLSGERVAGGVLGPIGYTGGRTEGAQQRGKGRARRMTDEHICVCGHSEAAHRHFRSGSDCGSCGAERCSRFRPDKHAKSGSREDSLPEPERGLR